MNDTGTTVRTISWLPVVGCTHGCAQPSSPSSPSNPSLSLGNPSTSVAARGLPELRLTHTLYYGVRGHTLCVSAAACAAERVSFVCATVFALLCCCAEEAPSAFDLSRRPPPATAAKVRTSIRYQPSKHTKLVSFCHGHRTQSE